jgi:hypothetical protein
MKLSRIVLSLVAALVFVAAVVGLYRKEASWLVWGLIYGNPVKWGQYFVPLSSDTFVASLPNDRLLVIGSKHEPAASLRVSVVPTAIVRTPGQCASVSPSCQIAERSSGGGKVIQIRCGPDAATPSSTTEHYCMEGTPIRITYSGPESGKPAFDTPIRAILDQIKIVNSKGSG